MESFLIFLWEKWRCGIRTTEPYSPWKGHTARRQTADPPGERLPFEREEGHVNKVICRKKDYSSSMPVSPSYSWRVISPL